MNMEIQELLPGYQERSLSDEQQSRVEKHLSDCADCRAELALLEMLAMEPVPDPGDAFWAALSGRVYRHVAEEKQLRRSWWSYRLPLSLALPRWAWAAAALMVVTTAVWLIVRPIPVRSVRIAIRQENRPVHTDLFPVEQIDLADLTDTEISAVDLWATDELALLRDDTTDILRASAEQSLDDRLAELNSLELEELSRQLDTQAEEG